MDGLCRVVASPVPVVLAGRTYLLSPLRLIDFGTIESLLLTRRSLPIDAARKLIEMPEFEGRRDLQEHIIRRAEADMERKPALNKIPYQVTADWIDNAEGIEFTAWLCLRREHPRFENLEDVKHLIGRALPEELVEFRRRRDMASGMDWFAKMDWPRWWFLDDDEEQPEEAPKGKRRFIPWRQLCRNVLYEYPGLTFRDIGEWTLYELRVMKSDQDKLGGTVKMTPEQYAKMQRALRKRGLTPL